MRPFKFASTDYGDRDHRTAGIYLSNIPTLVEYETQMNHVQGIVYYLQVCPTLLLVSSELGHDVLYTMLLA